MGRQIKKAPSAGVPAETIARLAGLRRRMLLTELLYFIALLILGTMVFWMDMGGTLIWALVVLGLTAYFSLVRPMNKRYLAEVRRTLLIKGVCRQLEDVSYSPNTGISRETVDSNGFFPLADYPLTSREYLSGRLGQLQVELADVTFPISENGRNAMFNGTFLSLTWPGAHFPETVVRAGVTETEGLSKAVLEQLRELGSFIHGSLYLRAGEEEIRVLLRGRLLGISLNPLMAVNEMTMNANIYPELDQAIRLAQLLRLEGER